jgi:flagellar basal-body rod protein FlgC
MFGSLDISTSALVAQRTRLNVIAGNLANMYSTRRLDGEPGPYCRHYVTFASGNPATGTGGLSEAGPGVHVDNIEEDPSEGRFVFDPSHPDAIRQGPRAGWVEYPNVDVAVEMVDAIEATRAYEANITVMNATKKMISSSMRLLA